MKNLLLIILLLCNLTAIAQDTLFYDAQHEQVSSLSKATTYKVVFMDKQVNKACEKEYDLSGHLLAEFNYLPYTPRTRQGVLRKWYNTGQLRWEANYSKGRLDGTVKAYWENGRIKRDDVYEQGKMKISKCYTKLGADTVYYPFERDPTFPEGMGKLYEYLTENTRYPQEAAKDSVEGKVFVQFVVERDGSINQVTVVKGVNPYLDKEAYRLVTQMPKWIPGMQDGEALRIRYVLPISFKMAKNLIPR